MTGPPFRIYNLLKFKTKFMLNKKAKYFNPQNVYISDKSVDNSATVLDRTHAELRFIPMTEKVVKDLLTAEIIFGEAATPPPNPLSIPPISPSSSLGEFLNIPTWKIISALGPEGIILGRLSITNIKKPIATPQVMDPQTFNQDSPDGTSTTFTTNQVYMITYERDPNPTDFVCILTNFGVSNYAATHIGLLVPVGPENGVNIVNGEVVWDVNRIPDELYSRAMLMYVMFLDKGKKILSRITEGINIPSQRSLIIPQHLADGTPIDINKALNTFKYMSSKDSLGEYQFYNANGPIFWDLPNPDLGTFFVFYKN